MMKNNGSCSGRSLKKEILMIENCLFESRPNNRRKKPCTLAISTIVHLLIAGSLVVIPLMQMQAMPPDAPPPPIRSASTQIRTIKLAATPASASRAVQRSVPSQPEPFIAPASIPMEVAIVQDSFDLGVGD